MLISWPGIDWKSAGLVHLGVIVSVRICSTGIIMCKQENRPVIESEIKWMNEKEVALALGISVYTLRQHRHKRIGLPYVKYGRSVRYSLEDIVRFMQLHKINFF